MTRARLTLWLCADGSTELRASYCQELRARLVQRGLSVRVVDSPSPAAVSTDADADWVLVQAVRGTAPAPQDLGAESTVLCLHPGPCRGGIQVLPAWTTVAEAVDRTLAELQDTGALTATSEDIRRDEELMTRRLYDLGYL